jgi:asparagine synthase (glutamine-hydrolysing)
MCGIAGIFSFNNNKRPSLSEVQTLTKEIKHRGPDGGGYFLEGNVALIHNRLSIIDLSSNGSQPFYSTNQDYVIVFNGEIYNYLELKKELEGEFTFHSDSDTEVLLNAYIKWGKEALNKFNGMFSFAIFNKSTGELFCARDRFGVKPFYYYRDEEKFIFASEPQAIVSVLDNRITPNNQVIYDYLVYNRTDYNDNTFFSEIKKLIHGHTISIINNEFTIQKWYDLEEKNDRNYVSSSEYLNTLIDSVNLRLRSDVPVGITLSGGLDSSAIASIIATELERKDVKSFSAVYGFGNKGDESIFINEFKNILPDQHFIYPTCDEFFLDLKQFINAQQEPVGSSSIYASYKIMKEANSSVKVMLNGQGADEALAGYHDIYGNYFFELFKTFKWFRLLKEMFKTVKRTKSTYVIKTFIYFLLPINIQSKIRIQNKKFIHPEFVNSFAKSSQIPSLMFQSSTLKKNLINHFEYKLEHLLKWDDRNSMRFGIESRNPFLDFNLVEQTIHSNSDLKIKDGYTKSILRNAFIGLLPEKIRTRVDKIGFETPEDEWFRTEKFQEIIWEILNSKSFASRKFIHIDAAKRIYQDHLDKKINVSREIWKWINIELWMRNYFDQPIKNS